ncbi:hypothetical protein B484DRAFT_162049 [Ochromonadaceae sp. CCMP2298]|nr:hypothetical protein B484DRAFT_162049 [Ochromonadaceae sp. CCMP2298]
MVFETVRLGQAALLPLLLLQLLACNAFVSLPTRHDWIAPSVHRFHGHTHCSAVPALGSILKTPDSILEMMREVADGLASAQAASLPLVRVDIPLPVTGGTELDDWPGGIRQKYLCLQPLLAETLAKLNFSQTAIEQETFVPTPFGEDDCIGLWSDQGYEIVSFPTPETIPYLQSALQWTDGSSLVAIVNSQIFLDPLSRQESKDFLASAQVRRFPSMTCVLNPLFL